MINKHIKWIMLTAGLLTCSMVLVAILPQQGLVNHFGESLAGPLADIIVRSWGMLITITGGLLIYGAFHPVHRKLVIVAACCSKVWFIILNLWLGKAYLDVSMTALIVDSVAVILFLWYLFTAKDSI